MTLTQCKAQIRASRSVLRGLRALVNEQPLNKPFPKTITISRDNFERLEWGMAHLLKGWVTIDENGNEIKKKLVRIPGLYMANGEMNAFRFKGITVRYSLELDDHTVLFDTDQQAVL